MKHQERIVENSDDMIVVDMSHDGERWERRTMKKLRSQQGLESLLEVAGTDVASIEDADTEHVMGVPPEGHQAGIEAARERHEKARKVRHEGNMKKRSKYLWHPKNTQLVDRLEAFDPHSMSNRKMAMKHRGPYRVEQMIQPYTAELRAFDVDKMQPYGKPYRAPISALRPSTIIMDHLRLKRAKNPKDSRHIVTAKKIAARKPLNNDDLRHKLLSPQDIKALSPQEIKKVIEDNIGRDHDEHGAPNHQINQTTRNGPIEAPCEDETDDEMDLDILELTETPNFYTFNNE